MSIAVVTFLWGNRFHALYVNRLFDSVLRHTQQRVALYCFVDTPERHPTIHPYVRVLPLWNDFAEYGRCYRRMRMYRDDIQKLLPHDRIVMIDLDTVIVDNIDSLLVRNEDFVIYRTTSIGTHGYCLNPSFVNMKPGAVSYVYDAFAKDPVKEIKAARQAGWTGSDQSILGYRLREPFATVGKLDGLYGYRDDNVAFLPDNAKMVAFYGPHDPFFNHVRNNAPWIGMHWR